VKKSTVGAIVKKKRKTYKTRGATTQFQRGMQQQFFRPPTPQKNKKNKINVM